MDLVGRSMVELREIAEELGIKNVAKLRKNELLDALLEYEKEHKEEEKTEHKEKFELNSESDEFVEGILELLPDGYGFLRGNNYLSTPKDVYVSPIQIRRFKLDTGDRIKGIKRQAKEGERFPALIFVGEVNG